jgi:hypothetical protein
VFDALNVRIDDRPFADLTTKERMDAATVARTTSIPALCSTEEFKAFYASHLQTKLNLPLQDLLADIKSPEMALGAEALAVLAHLYKCNIILVTQSLFVGHQVKVLARDVMTVDLVLPTIIITLREVFARGHYEVLALKDTATNSIQTRFEAGAGFVAFLRGSPLYRNETVIDFGLVAPVVRALLRCCIRCVSRVGFRQVEQKQSEERKGERKDAQPDGKQASSDVVCCGVCFQSDCTHTGRYPTNLRREGRRADVAGKPAFPPVHEFQSDSTHAGRYPTNCRRRARLRREG